MPYCSFAIRTRFAVARRGRKSICSLDSQLEFFTRKLVLGRRQQRCIECCVTRDYRVLLATAMGDRTETSPLIVTPHDVTSAATTAGGERAPSATRHVSRRYRTFQRLIKRYESPGRNTEAIGDVLKEFEGDERRNAVVLYVSILGVVLHVAVGILAMSWLEGWSFYDAAYFCIVTTTTVGYGDITPTRGLSKLFVIYYVVVSIGIISAVLGHVVGMLIDRQEELLINAMEGGGAEDSDSDAEIEARKELVEESDIREVVVSMSTLLITLAIGVAVFMRLEKLSLLNAMYVTIISASTVGFGDLQPTRNISKMIMTIWLCFSTICTAKAVGDVAAMIAKVKQKAVQRRLMNARMDIRTLVGMDRDHDNRVDKTEFLAQMLIRSGKVEEDEVQALLRRFDELDVDQSGYISAEECS